MKTPYTFKELDDLLEACIEFTDGTGQAEFYAGNIAGRGAVIADFDYVKRAMEWLAETDRGILESVGFDMHNIYHYRLGTQARQLLRDGGFRNYFRKKNRQRALEGWLRWSPLAIAFIALLISAAAWLFPRERAGGIEQLGSEMEVLKSEQEALKKAFATLEQPEPTDSTANQEPPRP